jgi:hypothetical protein
MRESFSSEFEPMAEFVVEVHRRDGSETFGFYIFERSKTECDNASFGSGILDSIQQDAIDRFLAGNTAGNISRKDICADVKRVR